MGVLKIEPSETMLGTRSPTSVLDTTYESKGRREKRKLFFEAPLAMNLRDRLVCDKTVAWLAKDSSSRLEELWLGPVFESSGTILSVIDRLPPSVTHLDLDLRNALHLLPEVMPILFSKTQLTTLSVRLFGDVGAIELAKWIHRNPNLKRLDLRGNRIGSMGARAIANALSQCAHGLSHLNMSCNCILDADMFSHLLATTDNLETLDLGFNWIGNAEILEICKGLKKNRSLRELNVFGCQRISDVGFQSLLDCIQTHNTSIHKIQLQAFGYRASRLKEEINIWLGRNRSGRYLLQQEVPAGLWPLVFRKIGRKPDAIYYLLRQGGSRI